MGGSTESPSNALNQAKFPQLSNFGKTGVNFSALTNFSSASANKSIFPLGIFPQLGSSISDGNVLSSNSTTSIANQVNSTETAMAIAASILANTKTFNTDKK